MDDRGADMDRALEAAREAGLRPFDLGRGEGARTPVPDGIRTNAQVQALARVAAAEDVRWGELNRLMKVKYQDAPPVAGHARDDREAGRRLVIGEGAGKVVHAGKDDVERVKRAEADKLAALSELRDAVGKEARKLGVADDVKVQTIANALYAEARDKIEGKTSSAPPTPPQQGRAR